MGSAPSRFFWKGLYCMIDAFSALWQLLTMFFSTDVIYVPLFEALLLLNLIMWAVYMLIGLLDPDTWSDGWRF